MRRYRENILWHRGAQKMCESRAAPTRVKTAISKILMEQAARTGLATRENAWLTGFM